MTGSTDQTPSKPKRKVGCRTWLVRIALMLLGPLFLLLLIEIVWQMIGDPRFEDYEAFLDSRPPHFRLAQRGLLRPDPDPEVSFSIVPGFDETIAGNRYRIAPGGLRGEPVPREKPAGHKRILVLGDSYAFGFGVGESETIGAQLQAVLRSKTKGIDVLTLGVPGYQTGQELAVLKRDGLTFDPDLVVLVYYANDNFEHAAMFDPRIKTLYNDELPLPRGLKQVLIRSILYAKVTKGYTTILQNEGTLDSRGPQNFPMTAARVRAMADLLSTRGVAFAVVAIPALANSTAFIDLKNVYNQDHDRLLALTEEQRIPTVDVRAILLARAPRLIEELFVSIKPSDSHLTGEGYGLIVKALAQLIESKKLLR